MSSEPDIKDDGDVGNSSGSTPNENKSINILELLTDAQMNSDQLGSRSFDFVRNIRYTSCEDLRAQLLQAVEALAENPELWRVKDQPVLELPSDITNADDYGLICYLLHAARRGESTVKFMATEMIFLLQTWDENKIKAESLAVPHALAKAQNLIAISRSAADSNTTLEASPGDTTVAMPSLSPARDESLREATSQIFDTPGSKMQTTPRVATLGTASDTEKVNHDKLKRMSQVEQAQYMKAHEHTEAAIREICKINDGPTTPVALTQGELRNLMVDIQKQSGEVCGTKKTKTVAQTEFGVLQTILHILRNAQASNGVLIGVLNQSTSHETFLQKYRDAYNAITGWDLSEEQKNKLSLDQRKSALMRQDDEILISIVETGFTKLSPALAASCSTTKSEWDRNGISLTDVKNKPGAGLRYLLEAITALCQPSWDVTRDEFEKLLQLPHVIEIVSHGSIETMDAVLRQYVDNFELKMGTIDSDMVRAFLMLTMLKNLKSERLKSSLEDVRKPPRSAYDPTARTLTEAYVEAQKAINAMKEDESKHPDADVREKAKLKPKNIKAELEKFNKDKAQSYAAKQAKTDGYRQGVAIGLKIGLGDEDDQKKAADEVNLAFTATDGEKRKMEETKKKYADEAEAIGKALAKGIEALKSNQQKTLSDRENASLKELENKMDRIRNALTKNKSEGAASSRGPSRSPSSEPGMRSSSSSQKLCRNWARKGECKFGDECRFDHPPSKKGPKSTSPSDTAGNETETKAAPMCANDQCLQRCGKNPRTDSFYKFCSVECKNNSSASDGCHTASSPDLEEQVVPECNQVFDVWATIGFPQPVDRVSTNMAHYAREVMQLEAQMANQLEVEYTILGPHEEMRAEESYEEMRAEVSLEDDDNLEITRADAAPDDTQDSAENASAPDTWSPAPRKNRGFKPQLKERPINPLTMQNKYAILGDMSCGDEVPVGPADVNDFSSIEDEMMDFDELNEFADAFVTEIMGRATPKTRPIRVRVRKRRNGSQRRLRRKLIQEQEAAAIIKFLDATEIGEVAMIIQFLAAFKLERAPPEWRRAKRIGTRRMVQRRVVKARGRSTHGHNADKKVVEVIRNAMMARLVTTASRSWFKPVYNDRKYSRSAAATHHIPGDRNGGDSAEDPPDESDGARDDCQEGSYDGDIECEDPDRVIMKIRSPARPFRKKANNASRAFSQRSAGSVPDSKVISRTNRAESEVEDGEPPGMIGSSSDEASSCDEDNIAGSMNARHRKPILQQGEHTGILEVHRRKRAQQPGDLKTHGISLRVVLNRIRYRQMRDECLAHMKRTGVTIRAFLEIMRVSLAQGERTGLIEVPHCMQAHIISKPHPASTFMCLGAEITRLISYNVEFQKYLALPAFASPLDRARFLQCYKISMAGRPKGVVLNLFDPGSTLFLSSHDHHFPVEIECAPMAIKGIGDAQVSKYAPQALSFLDSEAKTYITATIARGYRLDSLGFAIVPSGPLEAQGFEFCLREVNPYFIAPAINGERKRGYLIKDYFTGLTWIPERPQAEPSVKARRALLNAYKDGAQTVGTHDSAIGEIERMPTTPDTKENIDAALAQMQSDTAGGGSAYHTHGCPSSSATQQMDLATPHVVRAPVESTPEGNDSTSEETTSNDARAFLAKAEIEAAKRVKPVYVKIPLQRMLNPGVSDQCLEFLQYWHKVGSHLEWETILDGLDFVDGGDFIKSIYSLCKAKEGPLKCGKGHCDACARMKTKLVSPPSQRTTRPSSCIRPEKLYIDASGRLTKSVYHGYQYYLLSITEKGFILIQFMTYKSQTLFQIKKTFNEIGGPPPQVGIDGAGELKSATATRFFAHENVGVDDTVGGHHWMLARAERPHETIKSKSRCCMAHANAPVGFWPFAVRHVVLTLNLLLRAKDPKTREKLNCTLWESHYGEQPDIRKYLVGPWGCLAYVTLTKEARMAKGLDKAWGARAIGGIFLGCHVNPRTNVYHFLIHDGHSIVSTVSDIRIVGDCFPFKWQRGRDLNLRLEPPGNDELDDNVDHFIASGENEAKRQEQRDEHESAQKGKLIWVSNKGWPTWPCLKWTEKNVPEEYKQELAKRKPKNATSILVFTLGDRKFHWAQEADIYEWNGKRHSEFMQARAPKGKEQRVIWKKFRLATAEAQEEWQRPGSHWPDKIGGDEITLMVQHAQKEHDKLMTDQLNFAVQQCWKTSINLHDRFQSNAAGFTATNAGKSRRSSQRGGKTTARPTMPARGGHRASGKRDVRETNIHPSIIDHAITGPLEVDQYLQELEDTGPQAEMEDPTDFDIETYEEFEIEEGVAHGISHLHPIDFSNPKNVPRAASHPAFKLVGRKVRKTIQSARPRGMKARAEPKIVKGVVVDYDVKSAFFKVCFDGGTIERIDAVNLKEILVLDKTKGDPVEKHGKTRQDVAREEIKCALMAEMCEEYVYNAIPSYYGENDAEMTAKPRRKTVKKVVIPDTPEKNTLCVYGINDPPRQIREYKVFNAAQNEEKSFAAAVGEGIDMKEFEDVPRDDEPRNKAEAERHRCAQCQKNKAHCQPCNKCLEERNGIFESWAKEVQQMSDLDVFERVLSDEEVKELKKLGTMILSARMVTKRKYEAIDIGNGAFRDRFLKFKGRLAAVGTREVQGLDTPWSTFSPVVGMTAVRTLMSMVCGKEWEVNAYDLSGAFLGAPLNRDVYMKLPPECGHMAGKTVKLKKSIYGLKTSSQDYTDAFAKRVMSFEYEGHKFERLATDTCVFRLKYDDNTEVILCNYVDDLICAVNSPKAKNIREALLDHIRKQWAVTDEGPMTRFIGLNFMRGEDGMSWNLSCAPYIDRIGSRFGVDDGRYPETPMDSGFVITPEDLQEEVSDEDKSLYRSLIGSIGFAATTVRYDIAYAVSTLSRYLMKPNRKVIEAAKRVVRYLLRTKEFKITWSMNANVIDGERINKLWGAVDASFASDPITRRSHSGYVIFNNGGAISWKSGLQKMVTLSSCESEYIGLCSAVVEICYLRQLAEELGRKQHEGTVLWEDNKSCIILAEGETSGGGRSKHIDIKFRFITEKVKSGKVRVRYIPTSWNYADLMTKPLAKVQFARILDLCVNPEVKGMAGAEEEAPKEDEMAYVIMLNSDTWW